MTNIKIKCYILLDNEYIYVPNASIHTDTNNQLDHCSVNSDIFDNILSEFLYEYDDDGIHINNKPLSDNMTDEEFEIWDNNNPIGEIITGNDNIVWWNKGKIEIHIGNNATFTKILK